MARLMPRMTCAVPYLGLRRHRRHQPRSRVRPGGPL